VNDETRFRRDVEREIKAQLGMAVALWVAERARLTSRSGPGFLRWSGKDGGRAMRTAAQRCLSAGVEWVDLEHAIKRTAANPQSSPYACLDAALAAQAERWQAARVIEPRVDLGIRLRRMPG
jgi:hypothetical protein